MFFNGNTEAAQKYVDKYSKLEIPASNGTKTETPSVILGTAENYDSIQNIDGQTPTGYNNNTNINQDKGGIDSGKESLDNRGHSQGDRQRSQTNAEAESKERRIRPENEEDFVKRITGASQKSPRKIRRLGNTLFAYTPQEADGSEASRAVGYLKRAGIDAIYCEGSTESNKNGNTTEHNQATTSTDGKTFVSSNATLSAVQIASHEAVHVKMYENAVEYTEYESVICDGLLWGTDEYAAVAKEIFEGYHRSKYEKENGHTLTDEEVDDIIRSPEYAPDFLIEFTAYVNEAISANSTETIEMFSKVFSNWDAVVEASRKFNEAIGLDFSSADTVAESSPIDSQSTGTDGETAGSGITELSAAGLKKDAFKLAMEDVTGYKELTEEQKIIRNIGHQLGWKVEFGPVRTPKGRKADGKISFATKTITIDPTSKKPIQFILKHELAHSLEQNKAAYTELQNAIMDSKVFKDYVKAQGFASASDYNADIVARYKAEGVKGFDSTRAEYKANCEMVANFVGDCLFGGNTEVTAKLLDGMNTAQRRSFIAWVKDFFAKIRDKLSGKHKQLTDEISKLEDAFLKTLNSVETKENTATEDGESYSLQGYSQHQIDNWSTSKNIVIYENEQQLRQFVQDALQNKNLSKKMYFGSISKDLAVRIKKDTGIDVERYNCTLRASEIKKIIKDHGNEKTEDLRGQRKITEDDFVLIPTIIQQPDEIVLSDKLLEGKPVINFIKTINGKTTVAAYVSAKHLDLTVQTMYSGKNKGNLAIAAGEQAPANTPEANAGTVPSNSILNSDEDVNYSISEKPDIDSVLDAVSRGEMSTQEAKTLLSKTPNKAMTPYDIAHLKPSDADITAEDGTPKMQGEGNRESKLYQSLLNSEIITEDVKKEIEADTYIKNYQGTTNKRTLKIAAEELAEGGLAKVEEWHQLKLAYPL